MMHGRTPLSLLLLLLPLLLLLTPAARAQQGFIQQDVILQSNTTTDGQVTQLNYTGRQTSRTYVDGLGRPIQNVAVQASPAHNDMIQPMAYDTLGRQIKGYLPYAGLSSDIAGSYRINAISTDQPNFYNQTTQHVIPVDADPFGAQVFENSPLQRVLKAGSIGNGFQPQSGQYYKTVTYRYNTSTDAVWIWTTAAVHTGGNNYAANTLSVTDGKDEDNVETQIFTDMAGRTILKRQLLSPANLDTYYIYNNSGMLINIIPPKATAIMTANGVYTLTQTGIPALLFTYAYDSRGRVTKKTVPGSITIIYIYDPLNRPVLVQDANMAVNNQWTYIKYDVKGRAISQGIYTDANNIGQTNMQGYLNGMSSSYATAWYESRSSSAINNGYYTNTIFPTGAVTGTSITAMAYEYYDNYALNSTTTYSYHTVGITGEETATTAQVRGMPTMVQKCTVGSGLTTTWLIGVTFYDHNLHAIQTQSNNILYTTLGSTTPTDYKTIVPDFMGMPKISYITKKSTASLTASVKTTLTYDHLHRVTAVDQSYNGLSAVHVAQYAYNELGQVMQKKLGATATGWLQLVDFRYNIRGQLTSINNSTLTNDSGTTDDDTNPVFGMTLLYDQTDSNLGNTAYHSGRLSAVKWMSKDGSDASSKERAFLYSYDGVDRYTGATYAERSGSGAFNVNHGWDEQITGYDENGNIKGITRNMEDPATGTVTAIDNLSYAYSSANANSLQQVTDGTGSNYSNNGFRNYMNNTSTSYSYDANGNLTNDPYKGISFNPYNVLNKPDKMTLTYNVTGTRYIEYIYDAGGSVLRKIAFDSSAGTTTTDYLDGFVYVNGTLSYITTPEGRVLHSGTTFTNEYTITDQQGNARVSFNNTGGMGARLVVQENSYYGFGMILPNSPVTGGDNKLLYNGGSEWQNDFQNQPDYYQTFNRNYDASIGRFASTDPVPESAESMTTYQYAGNMPVMMNDPMGDLLDINKQNRVAPLPTGPQSTEFDYENEEVGGGTNLSSFYGDVAGVTGGPLDNGMGLYYNDQGAYWGDYTETNGTFNGRSLYHAATTNTPRTGSLANAIGALVGAGAEVADANGNTIIPAGYTGGIFTYSYNNGTIDVETNNVYQSYDQYQNAKGTWVHYRDASQGGPGDEILTGFYDSRYIASDNPFGHLVRIDGAYVGNVSGLGFTVVYYKSDGSKGEFPVVFNMSNFTIPVYGDFTNKFAASELFVAAYNLAVEETVAELKYTNEPINPFTVRADFMIDINTNLEIAHPGSIFNGGANAHGNFPATPAQWLP